MNWVVQNSEVAIYCNITGVSSNYALGYFIQFLTYWIAYSHMIPISLYVIIEMSKLFLSKKMINSDLKMFFAEDLGYANCQNSDLIEELGQVEIVFSDKTGTLTQNKMDFKKC